MSVHNNLNVLFKNHRVISLGYSCIPKMVLRKFQNVETQIFDWVGTTLWGIHNIIEDGFPVITNPDDLMFYYTGKITNNVNITQKKYFIRYQHDFPIINGNNTIDIKLSDEFHQKFKRRMERFKELLESNQENIVSMHLEDNNDERFETLYDEIKPYFPATKDNYHQEQHQLSLNNAKKLVELFKNKYNKKLYMIYLTRFTETHYIESHNIIIINLNMSLEEYKDKDLLKLAIFKGLNENYNMIDNIIN